MQRQIANLRTKVTQFRRLKERARAPDTIKQFKRREQQAAAELAELEKHDKPTFWIDSESVQQMDYRLENSYQKHKTKNISLAVGTTVSRSSRVLVHVEKLSLGYEAASPLFSNMSFQLREGERIELRGRNGAGKTTLINAIRAIADTQDITTLLSGSVHVEPALPIGVYEQEVDDRYFELPLGIAIERMFLDRKLSISEQKIMQLLSNYLFDPMTDRHIPLSQLSGGQKARFQLICMLANDPSLLILDEPTNHLDLPSIEELEAALARYSGAIIYVSHDDYFRKKIVAEVISVGSDAS